MGTFFEDIQEVQPTEIVLPPRICTLLYERFNEELDCITQANGSTDTAKLRQVIPPFSSSHKKAEFCMWTFRSQ